MERLKIKGDAQFNPQKLIKDLAKNPLFTEVEVSLLNLNDCLIMQEEMTNCQHCPGLANCPNSQPGYCHIYDKSRDEFVLKRCKLQKEVDYKNRETELIKTLYMPKTIKEATLTDFHIDTEARAQIYQKVVNFLTNYGNLDTKGLYVYGSFGCGKTYLLGAVARELAVRNIDSLLIYFPDLIRELKESLGEERFGALINKLKDVPVLMLDDLGSENITTFVRDEILGPILNYRMAEKKPLFISSNLTPDQLLTHLCLNESSLDKTKAMRIMSRIGQISEPINMGRRK